MNERIRDLVVRSSREASPHGSIAWMERFAELIVEECCGVLDNELSVRSWLTAVEKAKCLPLSDVIKDHFGVE